MDQAIAHCTRGLGIWPWASTTDGEPDVVLACAGDIPTLETLAAADLLRAASAGAEGPGHQRGGHHAAGAGHRAPARAVRPRLRRAVHADKPVIFAYHGYPSLIHRLTYRRKNHQNLHVRGYKEEGTTTTPFDMVMLNDLDRFHLVMDVIDRVPSLGTRAATLRQQMSDARLAARAYTREHGEDDPAITGWTWPERGLTVRVLVVNAGSSSLKLRLLDAADAIERSADLPAGADGLDTSRLAGVLRDWPEPDVVGHRIVHGGTAFTGPARDRRRGAAAAAGPDRPGPAAPAQVPGRARRGHRAAARSARGGQLRHRVPRQHPGRRGDLCGAARVAGALRRSAATDSTGCRTPTARGGPRSWPAGPPRPAGHHLPSRRRRVARGRARRPQRRHHDGLHPAGRAGHGDPVRHRRPRSRALAGGARAPLAARGQHRPGAALRAARAGRDRRHARGRGGGGPRRAGRPARDRRLHPPAGRRHRGDERGHWRRGRARLHRRRGRALRHGPAARNRAAGVPRRRHRPGRNDAAAATPTSRPPARRCAPWSSPRGKTCRSPAKPACCWPGNDSPGHASDDLAAARPAGPAIRGGGRRGGKFGRTPPPVGWWSLASAGGRHVDEKTVNIGSQQIGFLQSVGSQRTVIFVHGNSCSARTWRR